MVQVIEYLRFLSYKISGYLYGSNFPAEKLYQAVKQQINSIESLALLLLHHNRRHIGLLSLYYHYEFSTCKDYYTYLKNLRIVPPNLTEPTFIKCYELRFQNYYNCLCRLMYDPDIDIRNISGIDIVNYCYSMYIKTYTHNVTEILSINDNYPNVIYSQQGHTYEISTHDLLLALLYNREPHTNLPFYYYNMLTEKYQKELSFYAKCYS